MGIRENKVERYLHEQVTKRFPGSTTRAWKKSNRDGVMDQIVFFLIDHKHFGSYGVQHFVEVKTVDGVRSATQIREADALTSHGATVACVYGHEGVDRYLDAIIDGTCVITGEYR